MDLNRSTIIWNCVSDIELKKTKGWQSVCSFSIATNRSWKDDAWNKQEQSEFHNVVLWGKLAELAHQYCKKWNKIYFEGRLQTRNWEHTDWSKKYRTDIIWTHFILLWGKRKKDEFSDSDKKHGIDPKTTPVTAEDIPF